MAWRHRSVRALCLTLNNLSRTFSVNKSLWSCSPRWGRCDLPNNSLIKRIRQWRTHEKCTERRKLIEKFCGVLPCTALPIDKYYVRPHYTGKLHYMLTTDATIHSMCPNRQCNSVLQISHRLLIPEQFFLTLSTCILVQFPPTTVIDLLISLLF